MRRSRFAAPAGIVRAGRMRRKRATGAAPRHGPAARCCRRRCTRCFRPSTSLPRAAGPRARCPRRRRIWPSVHSRAAWIIRAGCTCCPTATCSSPRPTHRPRPDDRKGLKGWVMKRVMRRAGSGHPSANRITLLRDADGDGVAETRSVLLEGLNSPFGMALVGDTLYIADTDAVLAVPYRDGDMRITAAPRRLAGASRRPDQPPLDQEPGRQPRRADAVRRRRVQQQRGRKRPGRRSRTRADPADRHRHRRRAPVRHRPAQSGRHGFPAAERRVVGQRQRTRRTRQRPRSGLHDGRARGRLLRLAVELLRPARRCAAAAGESGHGRARDRAGLRTRPAHRIARPGVLRRHIAAGALPRRRVRRPARLVEPAPPERLQGDLRAVRQRRARTAMRRTS